MGKLTKACLSADIPLYKQQNKQIKKLFHDVGHSLPFANNCRKTVQKFGATEWQWIKNTVINKTILLVPDENTLSGAQYLNILLKSLETPHVGYCYDCQMFTMCCK